MSTVPNISFSETANTASADIVIGALNYRATDIAGSSIIVGGWAFGLLGNSSSSARLQLEGDLWIPLDGQGEFAASTLRHELGHALGLEHTFVNVNNVSVPAPGLTSAENNMKYSIMSYNSHSGELRQVEAFQLYDIAALQYLYGPNKNLNTGNTTYATFDEAAAPGMPVSELRDRIFSIWDGGGKDTLDVTGYSASAYIDLRPGHFSSIGPKAFENGAEINSGFTNGNFSIKLGNGGTLGTENISIAFGAIIENAIGSSADDVIIGNMHSNNLNGGAGNDLLFGDGFGIAKADARLIAMGKSAIGLPADLFSATRDADYSVIAKGRIAAAGVPGITTITDIINGGAGDDLIVGGKGNNKLMGDDGADLIIIQSSQNNIADGGAGNDRIFGAAGKDTLIGGAGDDELFGGNGTDILSGGAGDDYLDGGAGYDTLDYSTQAGDAGATSGLFIEVSALEQTSTQKITAVTITNDGYGGTDTIVGNIEKIIATENSDLVTIMSLGTIATPAATAFLDLGAATSGSGNAINFSALTEDMTVDFRSGVQTIARSAGSSPVLQLSGTTVAQGGAGNDVFYSGWHNGKTALFDGGAGNDTYYTQWRETQITLPGETEPISQYSVDTINSPDAGDRIYVNEGNGGLASTLLLPNQPVMARNFDGTMIVLRNNISEDLNYIYNLEDNILSVYKISNLEIIFDGDQYPNLNFDTGAQVLQISNFINGGAGIFFEEVSTSLTLTKAASQIVLSEFLDSSEVPVIQFDSRSELLASQITYPALDASSDASSVYFEDLNSMQYIMLYA